MVRGMGPTSPSEHISLLEAWKKMVLTPEKGREIAKPSLCLYKYKIQNISLCHLC